MTRNSSFPTGAAAKKPATVVIDLMRPGEGTPWEDRGTTGAIVAYVKTTVKSIVSPASLLDHIRRPETTGDATGYAIISIVMWGLGIIIWNAWWLYMILPKGGTAYDKDTVNTTFYWLTAVLQTVLVSGGIFLFLKMGPNLYRSLAGNELKHATPSLIYNCFSYSFGPSIFALVPVYGWGLAALLIMIDLVLAGKRRLYMKTSSAVVNVIILMVIVVVVAAILYFVLPLIWGKMLDMSGLEVKEAPREHPVASPS